MLRRAIRCQCSIYTLKVALSAQVIRPRVSYNQNDETLRRNSLMYMSKAHLPIALT